MKGNSAHPGRQVGEGVGDGHRASGKLVKFEDTHRPVPQHRLAALQRTLERLHAGRANVQTLHKKISLVPLFSARFVERTAVPKDAVALFGCV